MSQKPIIPDLIWQTWKSKNEIPLPFNKWQPSFQELHPSWRYWLWDDADNRAFVAERFPWFLSRYDAYPQPICRVDAVRYLFLYEYGGFYADLDTMCLKSLEPLRKHRGVLLGRMGPNPRFKHSIPNAVMSSAPRQPFWLLVAYFMLQYDDLSVRPERITGPILLKRAFDLIKREPITARQYITEIAKKLSKWQQPAEQPGPIKLLTPRAFYPLDWSDPFHQEFFRRPFLKRKFEIDPNLLRKWLPLSYVITFWTHSWGDWPPPYIID